MLDYSVELFNEIHNNVVKRTLPNGFNDKNCNKSIETKVSNVKNQIISFFLIYSVKQVD